MVRCIRYLILLPLINRCFFINKERFSFLDFLIFDFSDRQEAEREVHRSANDGGDPNQRANDSEGGSAASECGFE